MVTGMNTPPNRFTLLDDGTLDTVVVCSECSTELRYHYDPMSTAYISVDKQGDDYEEFIAWALSDADAEHICNETP